MSHDTTAPLSPPEAAPTVERLAPLDDRVPFDLAAKALNVSRRTVERMVSDGRLERDTTATDAATVARVTRRSLVAALGPSLDEQVKLLAAGADDARRRDDLIATLVAGSWRERRRARREAVATLASRS